MNWHLSRLGSAVLFCVAVFCFVLVGLLLVLVFGFFWWWLRDGLLDCTQVLYQFTLEASQSADGHVYALINPWNLICNMQLNVLNDLAEAMKALVVSATARLSYLWYGVLWLIGSCLHSSSWQQRLRPCVGHCPPHHVVGVVRCPSLLHWGIRLWVI